ncbi:MAG TPA: ATP-binding protein, partial [Burkholderiaceae bacterium]|nr:ATP-binding protein [Burkholderiaceae bacterium]
MLIISVLAALGDWWQSSRQVRLMLIEQGQQVAEGLARQSKLAILTEAPENAADAVDAALAFPDIEHVEVRHVHGKLITSRSKGKRAIADSPPISYAGLRETQLEHETDDAWVFVAPILSKGAGDSPFEMAPADQETLGYVRIVQSKATMRQIMFDILIVNQGIALVFFVLFFLIVRYLTKRVTQPLTQLSEIMARAERGEADVHADIRGPKDISDMAHAFNSMMTVLQEREADLRKARDEALKFARLKAEFAATVSHEIRTPLNGVIGTLDMLMASNLPPRQRQFVEIAWDSAQYLLDLINNILDFSKLEAGKLLLEHAEFDLRHLAEGVVDLFGQQAHQKGLDIGYLAAPDVPQHVKGDARRIRQVLINLVGNAVKFTDRGEVAVRIQIRENAQGEARVHFDVHDSGIGVSDELRGEIFESFTQGDATATRRYSGSGLGLAISKQLVGLMGGEMGVDSTPGVGSSFWFELPVTVVPATAALESAQRGLNTGGRILIVEDSTVVRHFLEQSLSGSGFTCRSLPDANEALG